MGRPPRQTTRPSPWPLSHPARGDPEQGRQAARRKDGYAGGQGVHRLRAAEHRHRGGEVDANYFQHKPYPHNFNKEKGTHLASVAGIHFEPFGLYPGKTKTLDALADGAIVAVPNDATNEARALLLLQDAGLIELKNPKDINATTKDITSN